MGAKSCGPTGASGREQLYVGEEEDAECRLRTAIGELVEAEVRAYIDQPTSCGKSKLSVLYF